MREEKRKHVEHDAKAEFTCELHGIPVKLPSSAKYKLDRYERKVGPDLEVGKQAVLAFNKGMDRLGLYLAVLVDWDDEAGYWSSSTNLYFVVLESSNEKIPDRKGRIVVSQWPCARWVSNVSVISWHPEDFKKTG